VSRACVGTPAIRLRVECSATQIARTALVTRLLNAHRSAKGWSLARAHPDVPFWRVLSFGRLNVRCARSGRQAGLPFTHQALLGTPLHGLGMGCRFLGSGCMTTPLVVG